MDGLQEMKGDVQEIRQDIKDIRLEIRGLEMRTAGNEKDIININKQLDKISANTTWILRLIIGGIIGAGSDLPLERWRYVMIEITAMVGAVIGLSQIAKTNGLQTKYIPIFNLTLGIILGVLFLSQDIKMNIFQGMIIGLSASGLFDHTKIIKKDNNRK